MRSLVRVRGGPLKWLGTHRHAKREGQADARLGIGKGWSRQTPSFGGFGSLSNLAQALCGYVLVCGRRSAVPWRALWRSSAPGSSGPAAGRSGRGTRSGPTPTPWASRPAPLVPAAVAVARRNLFTRRIRQSVTGAPPRPNECRRAADERNPASRARSMSTRQTKQPSWIGQPAWLPRCGWTARAGVSAICWFRVRCGGMVRQRTAPPRPSRATLLAISGTLTLVITPLLLNIVTPLIPEQWIQQHRPWVIAIFTLIATITVELNVLVSTREAGAGNPSPVLRQQAGAPRAGTAPFTARRAGARPDREPAEPPPGVHRPRRTTQRTASPAGHRPGGDPAWPRRRRQVPDRPGVRAPAAPDLQPDLVDPSGDAAGSDHHTGRARAAPGTGR